MNVTDDYVLTNVDWATRSPMFVLTSSALPEIYFCIAFGFALILHSWYINRFKWNMVRIVTELACLSCSSLAILFLQCLDYSCSDLKRAILYNAVGNCFFGLISQTCDNYITFQRYHVIVGKTSKLHRILVILWYIVFLFLPWWPFYLILPIWYDQNSKLFINLYFIMSKSSISEHIYDFS